MKTIKQIADEIGVSKQAVQKRITREPLCTSLYPYISTKEGTKYIDETGETLIKLAYDKTSPKPEYTDVASDKYTGVASEVATIIAMLQRELEIKNKQIEELTATVRLQAEGINTERKNELAETLIDGKHKLLPNGERKPNVWQRIFGKKAR